jgi:hypothetical protein
MRQLAADGAVSIFAPVSDSAACALSIKMLLAMHPASSIHLAHEVIMLIA